MKVEIGPLNNGTLVFSDKITTCQVKTKRIRVRLILLSIIMISKCVCYVDITFITLQYSKHNYILCFVIIFHLHIAT